MQNFRHNWRAEGPQIKETPALMPVKAYSYLRFSTPDQMKGDSQRRQLDAAQS